MAPKSDSYQRARLKVREILSGTTNSLQPKEKLKHTQQLIRDEKTGELKWAPVLEKKVTNGIVKWGYASWAMGCNRPEEVENEKAILAKQGVMTEYNENLEPIFRSRQHRKEHCRALGFHDNNGGYGDP